MKRTATLLCVCLLCFASCEKQKPPANTAQPTPTVNAVASPGAKLSGPPGYPPPEMNKPYPGTGVVVQINRPEGWIELNHEEIKGLMPAMQMEFWVKDKSLLDKAVPGDRVEFTIVETEKGEYRTALNRAAKPSPSP